MQKIDVLLFDELPGGTAPHKDDALDISFHRVDPQVRTLYLAGQAWAFVNWDRAELPGLEVCRRLRCNPQSADLRITMVVAEASAANRRAAAQAGADDYLVGPVTRDIIVDRVAHAWSMPPEIAHELTFGQLTINLAALQARWRNRPLALMPTQLRLLSFLAEHPGQIFTRSQLMEAIGTFEAPLSERTVDVWVGRLRRALRAAGAADLLRTVRSRGYMLDHPRR